MVSLKWKYCGRWYREGRGGRNLNLKAQFTEGEGDGVLSNTLPNQGDGVVTTHDYIYIYIWVVITRLYYYIYSNGVIICMVIISVAQVYCNRFPLNVYYFLS